MQNNYAMAGGRGLGYGGYGMAPPNMPGPAMSTMGGSGINWQGAGRAAPAADPMTGFFTPANSVQTAGMDWVNANVHAPPQILQPRSVSAMMLSFVASLAAMHHFCDPCSLFWFVYITLQCNRPLFDPFAVLLFSRILRQAVSTGVRALPLLLLRSLLFPLSPCLTNNNNFNNNNNNYSLNSNPCQAPPLNNQETRSGIPLPTPLLS